MERFAGRFLFALPLFAEFKLAFLAWLVVPPFCGAAALYEAAHGTDGRIPATVELVHLSGWAPAPGQPQPLRPGSARARLADALAVPERPLPRE